METGVTDRPIASEAPSQGEPQPPGYRFSTEDLPEADRMAIFREMVGRQMLRQEMEPLSDHRFHIHGTAAFAGRSLPPQMRRLAPTRPTNASSARGRRR